MHIGNHALEHPPQSVTLTKALMPRAAEHRMIRDIALDTEFQNHLYARLTCTSEQRRRSERIADTCPYQHSDHRSGSVDGRPVASSKAQASRAPAEIKNGVDLATR